VKQQASNRQQQQQQQQHQRQAECTFSYFVSEQKKLTISAVSFQKNCYTSTR
jgi:hypothetical protein